VSLTTLSVVPCPVSQPVVDETVHTLLLGVGFHPSVAGNPVVMSELALPRMELPDPRMLPDDGMGQGPAAPSIDLDVTVRVRAAARAGTSSDSESAASWPRTQQ